MTTPLSIAQGTIDTMITEGAIPEGELVAGITFPALVEMCESLVDEAIKDHLSVEATTEDQAEEVIKSSMVNTALRASLIALYAAASVLGAEDEPSAIAIINADEATAMIKSLVKDGEITFRLAVGS